MKDTLDNVLNSIRDHIAVITSDGTIVYVNRAWTKFGEDNGMPQDYKWIGVNYLQACETAAANGDEDAQVTLNAIRGVIGHTKDFAMHEYPCHSPTEKRWFTMRANQIIDADDLYVVYHSLITKRVLLEQELARTIREFSSLANTDHISDVLNRRGIEFILREHMESARQVGFVFSIALIDIDNFKEINDTYGHNAGDDAIARFSKHLRENVREHDIVGRWGGDEFIIMFPHTTAKGALKAVEHINDTLPACCDQTDAKMTISFGIAEFEPDLTREGFVDNADKAMYLAKKAGRNQGFIYS